MAKKKKRADFQAPVRPTEPTRAEKAAAAAREAESQTVEAKASASDAKAASSKGAGAKSGTAKSGTAKSGAGKSGGPKAGAKSGANRGSSTGRSSGLSGRTQWALVIGAMALIIGAVLAFSFINAGGGDGVLATTAWDIPARDGDTDNGDDDGRIKLTDFNGTPTVVNFFASWCVECDAELPHFTRVGDRYSDQVDMIFVNANEDSGDWRDMMDRHDIVGNFPIGKDIKGTNRNGLLRQLGGGEGMPATAFYDASGRLIKFTRGLVEERALLNELAAIGVEL